jgi:hypothetical protein
MWLRWEYLPGVSRGSSGGDQERRAARGIELTVAAAAVQFEEGGAMNDEDMKAAAQAFDRRLVIPNEVIQAAVLVARFVERQMCGMHHVQIYGIGVRHFLSVTDMLKERRAGEMIAELEDTQMIADAMTREKP